MKIVRVLLGLALAVSFASGAQAKPYEFFGCSFQEGKTMADVDAWVAKFKAVVDQFQSKGYKAVVLTPRYSSNPETPDFFWMGTWPDATAMGGGIQEYFEDGKGAALDREFAKIASCRQSSLWLGRKVYESP